LIRNGIGLNADRQDKSVQHLAVLRSRMAESVDIVLPHSGVGAARRSSEFNQSFIRIFWGAKLP
jgi:hypothetical protein